MIRNLLEKLSNKTIMWNFNYRLNNRERYLDRSILSSSVVKANTSNYTNILIARNPYKRAVSSYLHILGRRRPKAISINYSDNFLNFLIRFKSDLSKGSLYNRVFNNFTFVHAKPQTDIDYINNNLLSAIHFQTFWDLEKIDYRYLYRLYGNKLDHRTLNKLKNTDHAHKVAPLSSGVNFELTTNNIRDCKIYNRPIPHYYFFYDQSSRNLVEDIYERDFAFFKEMGKAYYLENLINDQA